MKAIRVTNAAFSAPSRLTIQSTRPASQILQQQRTFVSNPFSSEPQTLTATRTLSYPSNVIFDIISDVASYQQFLPYCQKSIVTKTSQSHANGKTYPEEAKLVIGFNGGVSEEFWSRVYCSPELVVEAIAGSAETSLKSDEISHHGARPANDQDPTRKGNVLSHLATRWTLRPFPYKPPPTSAMHPETAQNNHKETSPLPSQPKTEVNLTIAYQFANPIYGALSQAAAPKVADKMIEAFEKRVKAIVEGPGHAYDKSSKLEGVLNKGKP